jgi:hypothetical protein
MDIRQALLKEHSKAQCRKIVDYIGSDKKRFKQLMDAFFAGEYRMTQRAAWPLSHCVSNHPQLITPYLARLLDTLENPGVHNAVVRNIIRLLQDIKVPKAFHGRIMTSCFNFISSETIPAAIKAFSLTVLNNLAEDYPEIRPELKLIIEERWDNESAAFRSRAKKIINQF